MSSTILIVCLLASAAASQPAAPAAPAATQPAAPAAKPNTPAAVPAPKPPAAAPTAPAGDDPRKTMEQMKQKAPSGSPAGPAPTTTPTPAGGGASPAAPAPSAPATGPSAPAAAEPAQGGRLLREGTFLASRRGRVIKTTGGEWQFHFDTGPENKADAPMVLMPCLNLQAIEKLADRGSEALSFTVSGQVFVYKGRNYLLPTMYSVNRRGDVTPAQ
jgi:hypothetical protein